MNSFLRLSSILLRLLGKFINEVSLISEMKRENKMRVLNSSEAFKAKYVARAFASVAFLPMLALAVVECRKNSANLEPVRDYVLKEMGAWGYSESYVRSEFDEAMKCNLEELNSRFDDAISQL